MQSFIALAGVVGLAAASYAPQYNDDFRATTIEAAFPTPYAASSVFRNVNAQLPAYSAPVNNTRFTAPLVWSTTRYIRTSAYTTYCPEATTLTFNTRTLTVTAATTLTVTDCYDGCEIVRPLPTTTIVQSAPVITTTALETFCPEPTTLTFSTRTFTVTEATTLTIPQTITTISVYRTVIPVQPTLAPVNSTLRTTHRAPVPTVEPYVPGTSFVAPRPSVPIVEPFVPGTSSAAPVPTTPIARPSTPIVEPFVPGTSSAAPVPSAPIAESAPIVEPFEPSATAVAATIIPPYPTSSTAAYYQPNATATGRVFETSPVLYTGAGHRVGAGALMVLAGLVALL